MNYRIKLDPFVTTVDDYHEFENVINYFHDAGIKIKYQEIGFQDFAYHAVFYQNRRDAQPLIKKMCKQIYNLED